MAANQARRFRFSIRFLLAIVTLLALILGGWIAYSNYEIHQLTNLRQQGAIVIIRDRTPGWLRTIGINHLHPFFSVPTVELYVTPQSTSTLIGNSDEPISTAAAQKEILKMAAEARSCGATDVQLILLDNFDGEWARFATTANSMSIIGDSTQRYSARLKANQDTGANFNP